MARRQSGNLIIGGEPFPVEAPVINFREAPNWDATSILCKGTQTERNAATRCTLAPDGGHYPYGPPPGYKPYTQRYSTRPALRTRAWNNGMNAPYSAVKSVIRKFVIHHDGCATADMCWNVLQNERGLSCHFLVDNDGTIYQTLDLALMGYHASEWNTDSIGVELCNRGDAKKEPNYYSSGRYGPLREGKPCRINGHTFLAFDYTKEQYDAMYRLSRALLRLLPNLPPEYPQSSPGVQIWDTIHDKRQTLGFAGYIGHYHLTAEKWDPGYFDFKDYCSKIRGQFSFFMFPKDPVPNQPPLIPQQPSALQDAASALYKMNEQAAESGFFPVAPWGEHRLWHGGVHLAKKAGEPIFAPFPGRLVAARMGAQSPIGSVNFLLLRHQMSLASTKIEFHSLYMHVADEPKAATPAPWVASDGWKKAGGAGGQVVLLDEAIDAGAVIGHVASVGPGSLNRAQVHIEIFSQSDLFAKYTGGQNPWEVIDGTSGGRFCDVGRVNDAIDGNKDGRLTTQEVSNYFNSGNAAQARNMVVLHVSEWTADPSWSETLRASSEFKTLKPDEIETLIADQISPALWWDAKLAKHAKLPVDGIVYHYHPVMFVAWINEQILSAAINNTTKPPDAKDAKVTPQGVSDDRGGAAMRSAAEAAEDPCDQMPLNRLLEGYDDEECRPQ